METAQKNHDSFSLADAPGMGNALVVEFFGGEVRVLENYVFVKNEAVPDPETGKAILAAVDKALRASGLRCVIFDTRETPAPPREVRQVLRDWLAERRHHDKVALVVLSDLERVANNMRAQAKGVELGAFHDLEAAECWLTQDQARQPSVMAYG